MINRIFFQLSFLLVFMAFYTYGNHVVFVIVIMAYILRVHEADNTAFLSVCFIDVIMIHLLYYLMIVGVAFEYYISNA